jgi:hypothetical protein
VDARLVARATVWAASAPSASGQTFNLTNGEVFSWQGLWPHLAEEIGVDVAAPRPIKLAEFLPAHARLWTELVKRHDLVPLSMDELLGMSHFYADYTFGYGLTEPPPPSLVSTIKVKQAGFCDTWDTEDSFRSSLAVLRQQRVLPDLR